VGVCGLRQGVGPRLARVLGVRRQGADHRHGPDADYYTVGRVPPPAWPDSDPPPVVLNTDPRPEGAPVDPSAVLKLVRAAQAAGWATRTGYSRGLLRTRSPGRYKDVEIIGVWSNANVDGLRWYAMHERTIGAATGWKWGAITVWSVAERTSNLKITELYERLFRA
jgi:hypothetical protein